MKAGILFSGGKDSCYAAYLTKKEGHELTHDWFFKIIQGDLEKRFE